jgi:uncharacterized membrane protein
LASTFVSFVLGGVWFTVLFGKLYAAALGRQYDPKAKPAPIFIVGPLICSLATTITSAILMRTLHIGSLADSLLFGAIVGVGYLVSTMTNIAINPNMPRPLMYAAINGPYFFFSSLSGSAILFVIR